MRQSAILLLAILSLCAVAQATPLNCQHLFTSNSPSPGTSAGERALLRDSNTSVAVLEVLDRYREFFGRYFEDPLSDLALVTPFEAHEIDSLNATNETARTVQKEVAKIKRASEVETVLYMASGFDGGSPFLVFNRAKTVFAVDQHPFVKNPTLPLRLRIPDDAHRGYTYVTAVDEQAQSLASVILWRLSRSIPNFRVIRVLVFTDSARSPYDVTRQHGLIEFDTGPGTLVRQYVHVNADIEGQTPRQEPWWLKRVLQHGFDGLLIKGAMGVYENVMTEGIESPAKTVIQHLLKNGGVVVDGDGNRSLPWSSPNHHLNAIVHKVPIQQAEFGYSISDIDVVDIHPERSAAR